MELWRSLRSATGGNENRPGLAGRERWAKNPATRQCPWPDASSTCSQPRLRRIGRVADCRVVVPEDPRYMALQLALHFLRSQISSVPTVDQQSDRVRGNAPPFQLAVAMRSERQRSPLRSADHKYAPGPTHDRVDAWSQGSKRLMAVVGKRPQQAAGAELDVQPGQTL
jgi:hypothetical protein